ncbi:MAG: hypothetical protein GX549_03785 [Clostridiales bacterium]|nr:hypothetical protein [Clostridiales bacterium]
MNGQKAIIILLAVGLVVTCILGVRTNNILNNQYEQLYSQLINLTSQVNAVSNNTAAQIQSLLTQQADRLAEFDYEYRSIDTTSGQAQIALSVDVKSVSGGAALYIVCRTAGGDSAREIPLERAQGLTYTAEAAMALSHNYEIDIVERTGDGGESVLNVYPQQMRLYDEFYADRVRNDSGGTATGEDEIEFDCSFAVRDFGLDEFEMTKVVAEIWREGECIDSREVTDQLISGAQQGLLEHYNIAIASGQIDMSMTLAEFAKQFGGGEEKGTQPGWNYYYYTRKINFKADFTELELDRASAESLRLVLVVTFEDGYSRRIEG